MHTALLLAVLTFCIMQYELALPLAMVAAALKLVHSLYAHQQFKQLPPNTSANIEFIKLISTKAVEAKEAIDYVLHDILYWNDSQLSTITVFGLLGGSVILFIALKVIRVRVMLSIGLWVVVLAQYEFFQDIGSVLYKSLV